MSTDEYEEGRRKGEQIHRMRSFYGQRRVRHLYDFGVANLKRLNQLFRARSDDYWRGYADGLRPRSGTATVD